MSVILARFCHHDLCYDECETYDAIDFGALPEVGFRNIIYAAVEKHIQATHGSVSPVVVRAYSFVWKDNGRGRNLLHTDEDTILAQMALARARGWVDYIHIEFTANPDRAKEENAA